MRDPDLDGSGELRLEGVGLVRAQRVRGALRTEGLLSRGIPDLADRARVGNVKVRFQDALSSTSIRTSTLSARSGSSRATASSIPCPRIWTSQRSRSSFVTSGGARGAGDCTRATRLSESSAIRKSGDSETTNVKHESGDTRIRWRGEIRAIQCRAWIWRYRVDNRTHNHVGYNLWIDGEASEEREAFIVAISEKQYEKLRFGIGDVAAGTAWPCVKAKHDIADYYRAGSLKILSRPDESAGSEAIVEPPFVGPMPPLEVFERRGARMLDLRRWRSKCMPCIWANQSAVEIEYNFGKSKRFRKETFCYGPRSCPNYTMGRPRAVPYYGDSYSSLDDGALDECCAGHREWDE